MDCPKCRQYNLPGSSYCEKCGVHLKSFQRSPSRSAGSAPYSAYPSQQEFNPSTRPTPAPSPVPNLPGKAPLPPATSAPVYAAPPAPPPPVSPPARPARRAEPTPPPPRPPEPAPFALLREASQGETLPLRWDRNLVGRLSPEDKNFPEVDLGSFPDHGGVSRRHAQITRSEGQVFVEDLSSANGTFLNEVRLQPGLQHPLKDQDEIRFASLRFRYCQA